MATIKAILLKTKKLEDGSTPIYIRLQHKKKKKFVSISRYVQEKDWDEKSGLVRKTHKDHVTINAIINRAIRKFEEDVLLHLATNESENIVSEIRKKEKKETLNNFFSVADKYFAELETSEKFSRISAEKPRVKHLRIFNGNGELKFNEIDVSYIKEFQVFLKDRYDCSTRTIMNHLVVIRTLYNYAIQAGIADSNSYPFGKGKIVIRFPESMKVGLTEDEVLLIETTDFTEDKHLQLAKDIWLFSFYLAGIRISDVFRLKWEDCIDSRLRYLMGKNNKVVSLKLPEKANAILNRYRPEEIDYKGYVFNILSKEDEADPKLFYQRMVSGNHKINRALKEIATRVGINKKLTCHISRHTFGHITADKISPQMLQKLYRHTDIKTTMSYQSNFIHKDIDEALETVLNF